MQDNTTHDLQDYSASNTTQVPVTPNGRSTPQAVYRRVPIVGRGTEWRVSKTWRVEWYLPQNFGGCGIMKRWARLRCVEGLGGVARRKYIYILSLSLLTPRTIMWRDYRGVDSESIGELDTMSWRLDVSSSWVVGNEKYIQVSPPITIS